MPWLLPEVRLGKCMCQAFLVAHLVQKLMRSSHPSFSRLCCGLSYLCIYMYIYCYWHFSFIRHSFRATAWLTLLGGRILEPVVVGPVGKRFVWGWACLRFLSDGLLWLEEILRYTLGNHPHWALVFIVCFSSPIGSRWNSTNCLGKIKYISKLHFSHRGQNTQRLKCTKGANSRKLGPYSLYGLSISQPIG